MEITNELLAAYAEGNVSQDERKAVRQYLTENPEELESVMMMMDEDYELTLDDEDEASSLQGQMFMAAKEAHPDLCYSAAAFAPHVIPMNNMVASPGHADNGSFDQRLGELLGELDL